MIATKTTAKRTACMMRASIETFFCESVSSRMTGRKSAPRLPSRFNDGGCGAFGARRPRAGALPLPPFALLRAGLSGCSWTISLPSSSTETYSNE